MFLKHHIKISIAICEIHQFHLYFSHEKHMVSPSLKIRRRPTVYGMFYVLSGRTFVFSLHIKTLKTFKSLFKNLKPFLNLGFF